MKHPWYAPPGGHPTAVTRYQRGVTPPTTSGRRLPYPVGDPLHVASLRRLGRTPTDAAAGQAFNEWGRTDPRHHTGQHMSSAAQWLGGEDLCDADLVERGPEDPHERSQQAARPPLRS